MKCWCLQGPPGCYWWCTQVCSRNLASTRTSSAPIMLSRAWWGPFAAPHSIAALSPHRRLSAHACRSDTSAVGPGRCGIRAL